MVADVVKKNRARRSTKIYSDTEKGNVFRAQMQTNWSKVKNL